MIDKHLLKLRARDEISDEEERAIRAAVERIEEIPADKVYIRHDVPLDTCTLLLDGIMCRFKDLRNGERQITELHVAGDFADLHSFTLKRLDHDILCLTPCRVAVVPHEKVREITEAYPHLARVYWFGTNLDAAIHREWELSLGRRTAAARIAHLFCELYVRLEIVGLARDHQYELPLTQADIAECLGLTSVHVNRMLKELRQQQLVEFSGGRIEIRDWAGLQRLAEFNPSYLYLERRPR
ncbi:Crp/Fnr family transcriptional regulator [Sphingosinicella sp. BN140058]|uniref:Crp/Fnr family transcriptional regulator n=1 Tax=Sphingosinicella sp. BN140058 TaxID=1892855 RepID=UPI001010C3F0|nr:Crp/Fnr family transcriptional regulator [Sphingosinicella sp. BN140058]QAY79430.1 Crp/Fnr family transcriptional regulator [Sphingosinicella sp. BN140058]